MHLVIDIGSKQVEAGLFEGQHLVHSGIAEDPNRMADFLKGKQISAGLIASKDPNKSREWMVLLTTQGIPCRLLETKEFDRLANPETLPLLEPARVANIFGAHTHFPGNDCIVVDLGSKIRFDSISKTGVYLGGSLFPDFEAVFDCLEKAKFSNLGGETPPSLGKNSLDQAKSGCYFGLLGALERIVSELRLSFETPSTVMTLATGVLSHSTSIQNDLSEFIDRVDPHLTLIGLNQILNEAKL
jgi:type III pantothenate kinase